METIKCCAIGAGLATLTFHVPFILALPDLFTLHSVLERNPRTPTGTVCDRFNLKQVKLYTNLEQVLSDTEIELVLIGTPNDTHYALAKATLEAGKHVLVDKPVTPTVKEAKELGELAKAKGKVLYAFQNRRWDQDYLALKKLLDLPETDPLSLGTVIEFESHFDRYRLGLKGSWKDEPRPAAGLIYDLGSHLIDQTLALFGRPTSITAFASNLRGVGHPDVDDNNYTVYSLRIYMHYPAGSALPYRFTAILRAHPLSAQSPQLRFLVRGQKGSYTKYGIDVQEDQLKALVSSGVQGQTPQSLITPVPVLPVAQSIPVYGFEQEERWGTLQHASDPNGSAIVTSVWPSTEPGCYTDLYRNLAAAIREGGEMAVKWEEATAVIEMIELAKQSAREGRTVEVPR
ncbi:NAD(P)-binding protein [Gymnopus androsaceus JB14]|uniref:NAD(P)-binding protein n=1 Tax=Gymnopus androsaceus JB14 TaxID=1447944 RepID=A0A6A4IDM9_9AGAR|nr:NAD(P)-binding protein [Gymnopus androsaceus JB14]